MLKTNKLQKAIERHSNMRKDTEVCRKTQKYAERYSNMQKDKVIFKKTQ